jgi:hypothetical protein
MTAAQTKKYWREWAAVRRLLVDLGEFSKAEADQERHEIHIRALGSDKSSKDLTNRDLDRIFDAFDSYSVLLSGPSTTLSRTSTQPQRRLIYSIERLGLGDSYIARITLDGEAKTADWRSLSAAQLLRLSYTLASRLRAKKTARSHPASPMQPPS